MLRKSRMYLSVAVLLALTGGARAADDDAKAIIARAIKAHGGEEALTKFKAGQAKNKGKIQSPAGELAFTQDVAFVMPDKLKETMEMEISGQKVVVTTLVNGDKVVIEANGKEIPLTDAIKQALKDAQYRMKLGRLVAVLKNKDLELASLGEIKVEGKPAVGVRISSKGQKDISLYFNKETGLLAKMEYRMTPPGTEKEITEERIIVEYGKKSKEGIPIPKKVLVKHDGETYMESEVIEAKFLETLDDSEFKK